MSIATELQALNNNILDAYEIIDDKGGIMPLHKNTSELSNSIMSIPMSITQTTTATSGTDINVYHTGFCPFSQENASRDFYFYFVLNSISVDPAYNVQMPTLLGGTYEGRAPYNGMYIRFDISPDRQRGYKSGSTDMFSVGLFAFGAPGNSFQRIALTASSFPMEIQITRTSGELNCYINGDPTPVVTSTPGTATTPVYFDNEIILGAGYTSTMTDGTYQRPFRSFSFSDLVFGYLD